ncbi:hypothetical protein KR222_006684, partial [Zaprionus bogoriensis]
VAELDRIMKYLPQINYNPDEKVWSGMDEAPIFSPDLSLGEITFNEMRRHPQLIAQISATENTVLTREELFLNSKSIASYMRNIGIQQEDVVGIVARTTTHISAVVYACLFNGVAFHTLNPNHAQPTMEKLFKITKPRMVFCDGDEYEKLKEATAGLDTKIVTMRKHIPGVLSIIELLSTPIKDNFEPVRLLKGNNQTLVILCSSGTTGTPKAVTNTSTHKFFMTTKYLTSADVQYCHNTLDWTTGVTTTISSGIHSTCRVISSEPFDPVLMLKLIEKYKITWYLGPPSHLAMMVNCPEFETTKIDSLKHLLYGGMCASIEVQERFRTRLNKGVLQFAFGFSELGATNATLNKHYDEKPNSVGRVLPGTKLKIVSPEGESLGPNKTGEVVIHPGQYWDGYFGNPETTREIQDKEGWLSTGDSGYVDDDGFLYISGRIKDMLKHKGLMYYPSDIEDVITQIEGVAEVCVFGVHDAINWDQAAAVVVVKRGSQLTAEDVVKYVKEHTDTEYLYLNAGCLIVSEIKRLANGKTDRQGNKEIFLANKK